MREEELRGYLVAIATNTRVIGEELIRIREEVLGIIEEDLKEDETPDEVPEPPKKKVKKRMRLPKIRIAKEDETAL